MLFLLDIWIKSRLLVRIRQIQNLFFKHMVFKYIRNSHKFYLIGIIIFCVFQNHPVSATREPLIRVLISKNKNLRIRSDRSIPLIIKGQKFSNKKIKGLTLKKESNRTTIFFDKNKQKIYDLKNKAKS